MLMILSPAKTINTKINNIETPDKKWAFEGDTKELVSILKEFSLDELCSLMKISDKLGILNYDRYRNFYNEDTKEYTAILAFKGEAYRGIGAEDFSEEDFLHSNSVLRILSGLYGVIEPLDKIKEYRLEMGTKLKNNRGNDLYEFWGDKVTGKIMEAIDTSPGEKVLVNLASKEYSSVLNVPMINEKYRIVDVNFLEYKDGKHKMVSMYAKKARGMMARYVIQNKINTVEEVKDFDLDGYTYNEVLSKENELVFTR